MSVSLMFTSAEESVSTYGNPPPGPWFSTCWSGSAGTGPQSQWWKHTKTSEEKSVVAFIDGTFRRVNRLEYTANVPVVDEDQRRHQQVACSRANSLWQKRQGEEVQDEPSRNQEINLTKHAGKSGIDPTTNWQWEEESGLLIYWNNWRWGAGCGCSGMMRRCVWEVNGKFYSSRK